MEIPTVSVVMSVLNSERFLAEAVESILTQNLTNLEFIIINDGPRTAAQHSSIAIRTLIPGRVYHQENKGLVESLNRRGALARGKYIARMDADDVAVPEMLQMQVIFLEQHPSVGVLGGRRIHRQFRRNAWVQH
jgi:glycosyltransferase involved in cell wall biosynthesis